MRAERCECGGVDGYAAILDTGGGLHRATAQEGVRQINGSSHAWQEPCERVHVLLAVGEQLRPLLLRPWAASQHQLAHLFLLGRIHGVQAMVDEGSEEARTRGRRLPVREVAKLDVEIERVVG